MAGWKRAIVNAKPRECLAWSARSCVLQRRSGFRYRPEQRRCKTEHTSPRRRSSAISAVRNRLSNSTASDFGYAGVFHRWQQNIAGTCSAADRQNATTDAFITAAAGMHGAPTTTACASENHNLHFWAACRRRLQPLRFGDRRRRAKANRGPPATGTPIDFRINANDSHLLYSRRRHGASSAPHQPPSSIR